MSRAHILRQVARGCAVAVPFAVTTVAQPALAATPVTWTDPAPMSLLTALLIFGGMPLALGLVISLLVVAPSLVRGDQTQHGVTSWTEPEWFGGSGDAVPAGRHAARAELESSESEQAGGASARW
ncbi:MAG: hypothetical protein ACRDOJ_11320 [Nocardioidaceae bacterium]